MVLANLLWYILVDKTSNVKRHCGFLYRITKRRQNPCFYPISLRRNSRYMMGAKIKVRKVYTVSRSVMALHTWLPS